MGESTNPRAKLRFDRRVRLEFHGATITSDAGLLACRELDDALGLTETTNECLQESRSNDSPVVMVTTSRFVGRLETQPFHDSERREACWGNRSVGVEI